MSYPLDIPNLTEEQIAKIPSHARKRLLLYLQELQTKRRYNKIASLYPDEGPLRRDLYGKHLEFFEAGAKYQQRLSMSGNRCGKTLKAGYETTMHLTGDYPEWWTGKVFPHPTEGWAAGNTAETTRDVVQLELLGPMSDIGSGFIPKHKIKKIVRKAGGVMDAVDKIEVENKFGGASVLGFKQYSQGRKAFEGTAKHFIWFDEECEFDVYGEALMRVLTTKGVVYTTFTPLKGLTELVMSFMPQEYTFKEAA